MLATGCFSFHMLLCTAIPLCCTLDVCFLYVFPWDVCTCLSFSAREKQHSVTHQPKHRFLFRDTLVCMHIVCHSHTNETFNQVSLELPWTCVLCVCNSTSPLNFWANFWLRLLGLHFLENAACHVWNFPEALICKRTMNVPSCGIVILNHFHCSWRSLNINKARTCPTPSCLYINASWSRKASACITWKGFLKNMHVRAKNMHISLFFCLFLHHCIKADDEELSPRAGRQSKGGRYITSRDKMHGFSRTQFWGE